MGKVFKVLVFIAAFFAAEEAAQHKAPRAEYRHSSVSLFQEVR